MRWLAILLIVAGAARADEPHDVADGFDHRIHDRNLVKNAVDSLPCVRCHTLKAGKLAGKPDHATCFTGACHGAPPAKREAPGTRRAVCEACHAGAQLAAPKPTVFYPPYKVARDFRVALGHAKHAAVACSQCHTAAPAPPHARCIGCHDGAKTFPMTSCDPCHAAAGGDPDSPSLKPPVYSMKSSFSHPKHAARSPAGKDCATCHAAIRESDDQFLPRPTAATCAAAGCHDGTGAFAVTDACVRCHVDPARTIERPKLERFSHAHHATAQLPCASCHVVKGNEVASTGHGACVKCHAEDFGTQKPRICLACHNSIEPWRHLVVDRLPPPATEFGATLRHEHHDKPCRDCHRLDTIGHELRPPRGHVACSGCHLATGGPAPQLGTCEGCHTPGMQSMRDIVRAGAAWSVRRQFHHATHAGACTDCHTDLTAATTAELATPAKATCAKCHEGRTAFKLTGTTCTRCHPSAAR